MTQPFLHDLSCALQAPVQVWSRPDGRVDAVGAQGIYCGDERVASAVLVSVDGRTVEHVATSEPGAGVPRRVGLDARHGHHHRRHVRDGYTDEAAELARQLLRAAEGTNFRMPELFGGQPADEVFPPVPYPASCRPQAWAAASAITIARALTSA